MQSVARIIFGLLAVLYIANSSLSSPPAGFWWALLVLYLAAQLGMAIWQLKRRRWLGNFIDLGAAFCLVALDPQATPPTLLLFLVFTLSSGVTYGLRSFLGMLSLSVLVAAAALTVHQAAYQFSSNTTDILFLGALLVLCAVYFLLLLLRNQLLTQQREQAAWYNPDTKLISQRALIGTAGWLIPLHERIGSTLTLVLVEQENGASQVELAGLFSDRLRNSDIVAHYDDALALLLPTTGSESAEALLRHLHEQRAIFRAAVMTVIDSNQALESALLQLKQTLLRTRHDEQHWLAFAARK